MLVSLIILSILVVITVMLFIDDKQTRPAKSLDGTMTGLWDGSERRGSVRINKVLKAKYAVDINKKNDKKDTISKNISLGGILMQLYEKLNPSTLIAIDIFLPNEPHPISAKGEVVWVKELSDLDNVGRRIFNAGIKFVSMNPRDKETLDRSIKGLV